MSLREPWVYLHVAAADVLLGIFAPIPAVFIGGNVYVWWTLLAGAYTLLTVYRVATAVKPKEPRDA